MVMIINEKFAVLRKGNSVQTFENGKESDYYSGDGIVLALIRKIEELEKELDEVDEVGPDSTEY